jgi:hypothetical protein
VLELHYVIFWLMNVSDVLQKNWGRKRVFNLIFSCSCSWNVFGVGDEEIRVGDEEENTVGEE